MNKRELASKIAEDLRATEKRKPIRLSSHTFHITDDDGNKAVFHVKKRYKDVMYTVDDVTCILDSFISVVTDTIQQGEEIKIPGFGRLGIMKRAGRRMKDPNGNWCVVEERFVPKFVYGDTLRRAARLYGVKCDEDDLLEDEVQPIYDDFETDIDYFRDEDQTQDQDEEGDMVVEAEYFDDDEDKDGES